MNYSNGTMQWHKFESCKVAKAAGRRSSLVITKGLTVRNQKVRRGPSGSEIVPLPRRAPLAFRFTGRVEVQEVLVRSALTDLMSVDLPADTGSKPPDKLTEYLAANGPLGLIDGCLDRFEYYTSQRTGPIYRARLRHGLRYFGDSTMEIGAYIKHFRTEDNAGVDGAIRDGYLEPWPLVFEVVRDLQRARDRTPPLDELNERLRFHMDLKENGQGSIQWRFAFPSLLDALWAEIAAAQVCEWPWATCKNPECRRPFLKPDPRRAYCTDECQERAAKARDKKSRQDPVAVYKNLLRARLNARYTALYNQHKKQLSDADATEYESLQARHKKEKESLKAETAPIRSDLAKAKSKTALRDLEKKNQLLKNRRK